MNKLLIYLTITVLLIIGYLVISLSQLYANDRIYTPYDHSKDTQENRYSEQVERQDKARQDKALRDLYEPDKQGDHETDLQDMR